MADPEVAILPGSPVVVTEAAPAPVVAEAPVVPAVEAAPAVPEVPAAPAAEVQAVPETPVEPARELTPFEKIDAEKNAAEAPKPDAKPGEVVAEPVEPGQEQPVYKFELPEVLADSPKEIEAFTGILSKIKTGQDTVSAGQELLNMHAAALTEYATKTVPAQQRAAWKETTEGWEKRTLADPEIGGSGHHTVMSRAARMRDALVSSARPGTPKYERDMAEFAEFDAATNASSHPALIRILNNIGRILDEPQAAEAPFDLKPPKGNGRAPRGIYSHPSSANMDK